MTNRREKLWRWKKNIFILGANLYCGAAQTYGEKDPFN